MVGSNHHMARRNSSSTRAKPSYAFRSRRLRHLSEHPIKTSNRFHWLLAFLGGWTIDQGEVRPIAAQHGSRVLVLPVRDVHTQHKYRCIHALPPALHFS